MRMGYLLKYTSNDNTASISKVRIIDFSPFLEIKSLYTNIVSLWNKIISSKWNRKPHWFDTSSFIYHLIMKINKKLFSFHLSEMYELVAWHMACQVWETVATSSPIPISHSSILSFSSYFLKATEICLFHRED